MADEARRCDENWRIARPWLLTAKDAGRLRASLRRHGRRAERKACTAARRIGTGLATGRVAGGVKERRREGVKACRVSRDLCIIESPGTRRASVPSSKDSTACARFRIKLVSIRPNVVCPPLPLLDPQVPPTTSLTTQQNVYARSTASPEGAGRETAA
jgi:hypothetical protein